VDARDKPAHDGVRVALHPMHHQTSTRSSLRAKRSNPEPEPGSGLLRRFAPRNDFSNRNVTPPHSRGANGVRVFATTSLETEGAGNAGCSTHPQPRVRNKKAHEIVTTGSPKSFRHSLREWFYGLLRDLLGDRALLPPSPAEISSASLIPASGDRDHTTSPSATPRRSSLGAARVHRIPHQRP
jgi:hypothetical protein